MRIERKTHGRNKRGSAARPASSASPDRKPDTSDDLDESMVPRGLSKAFVSSKLNEKKLRQAGLTPPSDFQGDMPELPSDIDAVDHSQLSNTIMAFQNALSTATWKASMAYIANDIYTEIAEYLENKALLSSEQSNDSKRRAEAKTDDDVLMWVGEAKAAYHDYVRFRDFARTIEGKIKVLSRVGGFKDDDNEASDRTTRPKIGKRRQ